MLGEGLILFILSFLLISAVLLWIFIKPKRVHFVIKIITIPLVIWYGMLLYHATDTLLGWPTNNKLPRAGVFIFGTVVEPDVQHKGGIYIWLVPVPEEKDSVLDIFCPSKFTGSTGSDGVPRSYRLPYTEERHRKMVKANKARLEGKFVLLGRKDRDSSKGGHQSGDDNDINFKVLNQSDIFPKEGVNNES